MQVSRKLLCTVIQGLRLLLPWRSPLDCVQLEDGGGKGVGDFMGQAWRWPISTSCTFHWSLNIEGDGEVCSRCIMG